MKMTVLTFTAHFNGDVARQFRDVGWHTYYPHPRVLCTTKHKWKPFYYSHIKSSLTDQGLHQWYWDVCLLLVLLNFITSTQVHKAVFSNYKPYSAIFYTIKHKDNVKKSVVFPKSTYVCLSIVVAINKCTLVLRILFSSQGSIERTPNYSTKMLKYCPILTQLSLNMKNCVCMWTESMSTLGKTYWSGNRRLLHIKILVQLLRLGLRCHDDGCTLYFLGAIFKFGNTQQSMWTSKLQFWKLSCCMHPDNPPSNSRTVQNVLSCSDV